MARSEWAVGYLTKVGLLVLAGQLPAIEQLGRSQLILAYADASDAREGPPSTAAWSTPWEVTRRRPITRPLTAHRPSQMADGLWHKSGPLPLSTVSPWPRSVTVLKRYSIQWMAPRPQSRNS
jgi:hypothetical protein